ncbi:MAG: O-antigen ligase family protein [Patescibacteria group bacterium]
MKNCQITALISASALLLVLIFLNLPVIISFILAFFIGLIPFFLFRPISFLYFLFLVTPSLRIISTNEIIFKNDYLAINFNAIINFSILFFGLALLLTKWKEAVLFIKKYKFVALFFAFIALAFLSAAYSVDRNSTLEEIIRITGTFLLLLYGYLTVKDKKTFNFLIFAMLAGAAIPSLAGIFQHINGIGWWDKTIAVYRIQGTFLHPATFSFYLLFLLPVIYALFQNEKNRFKKVAFSGLAAVFIFLIVASLTRGAWVGLLAMIIAFGIFINRKVLIASAAILFLAYLSVPAIQSRVNDVFDPKYNSSFSIRRKIVETTLPAFYNSPVYGYGFGSFSVIHDSYNEEAHTYESLQAHNDYLRVLIELGALGLAIFLSLYFFLYKTIRRELSSTNNPVIKNYLLSLIILWAGVLAVSFGDNVLRTMEVQYLLWVYTGAVLGLKKISSK